MYIFIFHFLYIFIFPFTFRPSREGRAVKTIDAMYSGELHLDDDVRISAGHEGNRYYISGEKEKRMFAISMVYHQV